MKKTDKTGRQDTTKPALSELEEIEREVGNIGELIADARRVLNEATDAKQRLLIRINEMRIAQLQGKE